MIDGVECGDDEREEILGLKMDIIGGLNTMKLNEGKEEKEEQKEKEKTKEDDGNGETTHVFYLRTKDKQGVFISRVRKKIIQRNQTILSWRGISNRDIFFFDDEFISNKFNSRFVNGMEANEDECTVYGKELAHYHFEKTEKNCSDVQTSITHIHTGIELNDDGNTSLSQKTIPVEHRSEALLFLNGSTGNEIEKPLSYFSEFGTPLRTLADPPVDRLTIDQVRFSFL
jgi:hypothetical protein